MNVATGQVTLSFTDFALSGPAPLRFSRGYSSQAPAGADLGFGWTLELGASLRLDNDALEVIGGAMDGVRLTLLSADVNAPAEEGAPKAYGQRENVIVVQPTGERLAFRPAAFASSSWLLFSEEDANGNELIYTYDARDRLTAIEDFRGRRCELIRGRGGAVVELRLHVEQRSQLQRLVTFEYDDEGDLRVSRDANGASSEYGYVDHLIASYTNPTRGTTYFAYDDRRRCVRTWQSNGCRTRIFDFHPVKPRTVLTDSLGWRTAYTFNAANLVVERVDPLGDVKITMYDPENNLLFSDDEEVGDGGMILVDHAGRRIKHIDRVGSLSTDLLDPAGRVLKRENPVGDVSAYEYDKCGNVVAVTSPLGACWRAIYDKRGVITSVVDPVGREVTVEHSADLSRATYRDALGLIVEFEYDTFGRIVRAVDGSDAEVLLKYDPMGKPLSVRRADGGCTSVRYGAAGKIVEVEDGLGRRQQVEYDGFGKPVALHRAGNRRVELSYDSEERLAGVTNEVGERTAFHYDALGALVSSTYFDGTKNTFEQRRRGAETTVVRADGQRVVYEQDATGRVSSKRFADGTAAVFAWDPLGRLAAAENAECSLSFEYDSDGRLMREHQDQNVLDYSYDPLGRLTEVKYDARRIAYRRDIRGAVVGIEDSATGSYEIRRDRAHRAVEIDGPNGVCTALTFDAAGRLSRQAVTSRGALTVDRSYSYDRAGCLTTVLDAAGGSQHDYQYDELGQTVHVRNDGRTVEHFAYDARGNTVASHRFASIEYGRGNRPMKADGQVFGTDAQGNLTERSFQGKHVHYTYGSDNELLAVTHDGGEGVSFEYDALLRRLRKKTGAATTEFVWCGDSLLAETTGSDPMVSYLHLSKDTTVLAQGIGDQVFQCVWDQLGRPTELIDAEGTVAWSSALPWAEAQSAGGLACALRYPGQYFDRETGLVYNRTRYLDPSLGRYISPDPLPFLQGLNPYTYVDNSFPNAIDPLGLASCFRSECDNLFKDMANIIHTEFDRETHVQTQPYPGAANVPHAGMVQRAAELIRNIGQQPAARLPGDPLGQRMTGDSHVDQYLAQQGRLQRALDRWTEVGCKPRNTSDPTAAGRTLQDADTNVRYQPFIKHAGDAAQKFGKA